MICTLSSNFPNYSINANRPNWKEKPVIRVNITYADDLATPNYVIIKRVPSLIARFMGPTWGPPGADRTQVGPVLAPWILLSGMIWNTAMSKISKAHRDLHNTIAGSVQHRTHIVNQIIWLYLGHKIAPCFTPFLTMFSGLKASGQWTS